MCSPFLLQGSEVLLEGRADLAQQLHQRMAQEAGVGWLGVEGVGSRSVMHTATRITIIARPRMWSNENVLKTIYTTSTVTNNS